MIRLRAIFATDDRGQSFVEVALMLPVLLLIVLGVVDVGRTYAFKTATANAAREAAMFAARDPQATRDAICQRARNELGVGLSPSPCADGSITVVCVRATTPPDCGNDTSVDPVPLFQAGSGADVSVTVRYDVSLITGFFIERVFPMNPVNVSATAVVVGLGD